MPISFENPPLPENLEISYPLVTNLTINYEELIYNAISAFKLTDKDKFLKTKIELNEMLIKMEELNDELTNKYTILDNSIENINGLVNNLKLKNVNINTEFDLLIEGRDSSSQLIDDFKKKYYLQYTTNWSIAIGVVIVIYLGYYIFQNKSNVTNTTPNTNIPK